MLLCASHASHVHPPGCTCFIPESLKSLCRPQTSWLPWLLWLLWLGPKAPDRIMRRWRSKVGKQKGVELALFSPVDFDERLQGSWCGPWVHDGPWWSMGFGWFHATSRTTMISVMLRFCLILVAVWVVWHSFNPGISWFSLDICELLIFRDREITLQPSSQLSFQLRGLAFELF